MLTTDDIRTRPLHESWKEREARAAALHRDAALSALIAWRMQQEQQLLAYFWTASTVVPADPNLHHAHSLDAEV